MDKSKSLKEYISKAKIIIQDDKKLKELIDDVLKKLKYDLGDVGIGVSTICPNRKIFI